MAFDRRALLAGGLLAASTTTAGEALAVGPRARKGPLTLAEAVRDAPDPKEVIALWPAGPPGGEQVTAVQATTLRPAPASLRDRILTHVRTPTLTVFRPAKPNGAAVIVAPGGGYEHVTLDKEGFETARFLASRGYIAFVLVYRFPRDGWAAGPDVALQDAQRAVRLVRAGAARFGIDPQKIVMQGFSAGGHLAGMALTRFDEPAYAAVDAADGVSARPDLGCLTYAVTTLFGAMTVVAPDGQTATPGQLARAEVIAHVRPDTPPTILFHAADDPSVPVEGSVRLFTALKAAKVKTEMHIFEEGRHGWGLRGAIGRPNAEWPILWVNWMHRHGF